MKPACGTSRIRDILVKLLKLVFLLKALHVLKTGPPNLGILYTLDHICTDYNETCMCDLLGFATCRSNY